MRDSQLRRSRFTLDGYRIVQNPGLVRSIVVRSRSILGTIGARYDATEVMSGLLINNGGRPRSEIGKTILGEMF